MSNKSFIFSDVLGYGWRVMKANIGFFIALGIVWFSIAFIPALIDIITDYIKPPKPIFSTMRIFTTILSWAIGIILGIGIIKIALSFCDGKKPSIGLLFDAWDCFWRYLGAAILYNLIILGIGAICGLAVGLLAAIDFPWPLLIIIPVGSVFVVRFAIKFYLCFYFVIDKGLGPVQALKASSRTTMGVKWNLLGFTIVCGLINLLGLLCLIVGTFATYPTVLVANALVYRQLMAQTPELTEFEAPRPTIQPNPNLL